jgi:hypothetical protein
MGTWREKTGFGRRRVKKVQNVLWAERDNRAHGEMRESRRKERGEILNEDGREIRWTKEIMEEEGKDRGGKGWKKDDFWKILE